MDGTTIPTVLAITGVFALLIIETAHSIRAQQRSELITRRLTNTLCLGAARRAARHTENLLTLQYFAGNDSPATLLAERQWLEATYSAPAANIPAIRHRRGSIR